MPPGPNPDKPDYYENIANAAGRQSWTWPMTIIGDLRAGAHLLARRPGSTLAMAALLALGIGASTVVFSVFDAVLLRPLPVRHPGELVRIVQHLPRVGTVSNFPTAYYEALRDHSTALAMVFGETARPLRVTMTDPASSEQITVSAVTPEFFDALGTQALYGRVLTAEDAKEDSDSPPVVLSYGLWVRQFEGDPQVLGRMIGLQGHKFVVVGVMPREFNGYSVDTTPDVRIPLGANPLFTNFTRAPDQLALAGRMKPGFTRLQAEAECLSIWQSSMGPYYRGVYKDPKLASVVLNRGVGLDPLEQGLSIIRDRFGTALTFLMAAVGVLLVIACTNLAGLQLVRAASRGQEMAVRMAVGATRSRLVQQMFAENLWVMFLGALGGLFIALAATPLAVRMLPPMRDLNPPFTLVPVSLDVRMNSRAFLFSMAASTLALMIFGFAPAAAACRVSLDTVLRSSRSTSRWRGRQALIVIQIALCTFLLTDAALFVRTYQELHRVGPGFDSQHVATFTANTEAAGYTEKTEAPFLKMLTERVRQIPGVLSVAIADRGVMRGRGGAATVAPVGERTTQADFLNADTMDISADYFDTMGIRLLAGRNLVPADTPLPTSVPPFYAVVNEAFAQQFFPGVDPIGKFFGSSDQTIAKPDFEIVGVVSNSRYRSLRQPIRATFYSPAVSYGSLVLYVRTRMGPETVIQPVQKTLASIDPTMAFLDVHTLAEDVDDSTATERMTATLASIFGGLASLLVGVGIYALLAYAVTQRQREIGVRMALGAQALDIWKMIGRQSLSMVLGGALLGLGGALVAERWIDSLLYQTSPRDPRLLAVVVLFVATVAALATVIPALRATQIELSTVLRHEE